MAVAIEEAIRRLTIVHDEKGATETAAKMKRVASAADDVTVSMVRKERATEAVQRRTEKIMLAYDKVYRQQILMAKIEHDLTAARAQGLITLARQNELMDLASAHHGRAAAAAGAHRAALAGLSTQAVAARGVLLGMIGGGAGLGAGLAGIFTGAEFIKATAESEKALAQLDAAIRSTGGAAGLTRDELTKMAMGLQGVTTYGDEAIMRAQGLLLTFTKIGRSEFPQAVQAILNVSTAMDQDLKASAVQVGKALNDPVAGLTSLTRAGIQFTEGQKSQIKTMVEAGRLTEAQSVILKELETQFGGSARAARDTLGGALAGLKNSFGDLFEVQSESAGKLREELERLTAFLSDSATQAAVQGFGGWIFSAITATLQGVSIAIRKAVLDVELLKAGRFQEFTLPNPEQRARQKIAIGAGDQLGPTDASKIYDAVGIAADKAAGGIRKYGEETVAATNAYQQLLQRTRDRIEELELEASGADRTSAAVVKLKLAHDLERAAKSANKAVTQEMREEWDKLGDRIVEAQKKIAELRKIQELANIGTSAFGSFRRDVLAGKDAVDALVSSLGNVGSQLADIGTKNLIEGTLTKMGVSGLQSFDPMSLAAGAVGIGISLITSFIEKGKKAEEELKKAKESWAGMQDQFDGFIDQMTVAAPGAITQTLKASKESAAANDDEPIKRSELQRKKAA